MAASIRTTRVAAITAGGPTQDVTISGFGTPTAVVVRYVKAVTDDTVVGNAAMGAGLYDGTAPVCCFSHSITGGASASNGRGNDFSGSWFIRSFNAAGSDDARASVAFITDGVRLTWDLLPPAGWLMTFTFITGTDAEYCAHVDNAAGDVDVTAAGFQPNFILTIGANTGSFPSSSFDITEGYCVEDSGVVSQGSFSWWEQSGASNCSPMVVFDTAASKRVMFGGGLIGGIAWTDFDANGATAAQVNADGCDAIYLMLKFPAAQEVGIFSDSVTTSTGNTTIGQGGAAVPAYIEGCFAALTPAMDNTWRGSSGDPEAGVISLFAYDGTTQICNSLYFDEGTDPVVTNSVSRSGSVFDSSDDLPTQNPWVGTASAFTAGGMTVNITTAPATERRIFGWYLEEDSAGGGITGTASITLGDVTASGAATLAISGSASVTLDDVTTSAAATLALSGAASVQLEDVVSAGAGALALSGAASVSLDNVTAAATGALQIAAAASVSLDDVTASGDGTLALAGQASIALDDVTASGTGELPIAGATSVTLDDVTTAATGALALVGSASVQLDDVTVTAEGGSGATGQASITLDDVSASGTGALAIAGAAGIALDDVSASGSGTLPIAGEASVQLDDVAAAGVGALAISGDASITLDAVTVGATGTTSDNNTGAASITLDDVTASATGQLEISGQSSISLDDVVATATGALAIAGAASIQLDGVTVSAASQLAITGSASITLDDVTIDQSVASAPLDPVRVTHLFTKADVSTAYTVASVSAVSTTARVS